MVYRVWQCSDPAGTVTSECDRVLFITAGQWTKCSWPPLVSEIWMSPGLGRARQNDACHSHLFFCSSSSSFDYWFCNFHVTMVLPCTTECPGVRLTSKGTQRWQSPHIQVCLEVLVRACVHRATSTTEETSQAGSYHWLRHKTQWLEHHKEKSRQ